MSVSVPVPPRPKEPYYEFDLVAALHKDAPSEVRALALLVIARELARFAQEMEFQHAKSPEADRLQKQAKSHLEAAINLMPK